MHLRKIGYWQLGDTASMLTNVPGSRDLVIPKVGTGKVLSCSRGGETCFRIPFWTIPKMSVCDPSSRKQSNQVLVIKQTLLSQVCWLWLEKVCNPTADNASLGYLILKANGPPSPPSPQYPGCFFCRTHATSPNSCYFTAARPLTLRGHAAHGTSMRLNL